MKFSLIQMNPTTGDFQGNLAAFKRLAEMVKTDSILVGPELTLSGYPIQDLLDRAEDFLEHQDMAILDLAVWLQQRGQKAIIGRVAPNQRSYGYPYENQAILIDNCNIEIVAVKRLLPTYDIFDERRYFEPGEKSVPIVIDGIQLGVIICEDGWASDEKKYREDPILDLAEQGAEIILSLNASPSNFSKASKREELFSSVAAQINIPIVSVNQTGATDDLIFDGASFVAKAGTFIQAPLFAEGVFTVDMTDLSSEWKGETGIKNGAKFDDGDDKWIPFVRAQLVTGIRDFFFKNGMKKAAISLSGGADSSLVLALTVDALGADNVTTVTMPSEYSSAGSVTDSQILADMLGVKLYERPIANDVRCAMEAFAAAFSEDAKRLTLENIQARIRGTTIMSWSNQTGALVLATGNKSEVAMGYCTLYGDTNGALNPIGDLYKTEVYRLLNAYAQEGKMPMSVIEKAPSAELFPGQVDQDSLPPYDVLDAFLQLYLEPSMSIAEKQKRQSFLQEKNFTVERGLQILKQLELNEFKRQQLCPVLRIRSKTFSAGRNIPLARKSFLTENTVKRLLGLQ